MKRKWVITIFLMLIALSACQSNKELSLSKDQPPDDKQETITSSPSPTLEPTATPTKTLTKTPTVTLTPTIFPTPVGEIISDTVVDFSFFVPENYENISGIYRRSYSFAAIYQEKVFGKYNLIKTTYDLRMTNRKMNSFQTQKK